MTDKSKVGEWGHFRGNPRHSGASCDPGPADGTVRWTARLGRQWTSAPLYDGHRLYAACPGRKGVKLLCVDPATGGIEWAVPGHRHPEPGQLPAAMRLASPVIDAEEHIIVRGSNRDGIYRIAKSDGRLVDEWTGDYVLDYRSPSAPMLGGDAEALLLAEGTRSSTGADPNAKDSGLWKRLVCRDSRTGEKRWTFTTGQFFGQPVHDGKRAFVGTADGHVLALELDGDDSDSLTIGSRLPRRLAWTHRAEGAVHAAPLITGNRLIFGDNSGSVRAIDKSDGTIVWIRRNLPTDPRAFAAFSAAASADGIIAIGTSAPSLMLLDEDTGDTVAEYPMPDWVRARPLRARGGWIAAAMDGTVSFFRDDGSVDWSRQATDWILSADPVPAGDVLAVIGGDVVLRGLDPATGAELWSIPLVDHPGDWVAYDEFQASAQAAGGRVVVGTPGRLVAALDADSGAPLWKKELGGEVPCDPLCDGGRVYVGQQGGEDRFFCLDAADGTEIWEAALGRVWAAPALADGVLYVAAAEGFAYAMEPETGRILWRYGASGALYMAPTVVEDLVIIGTWDQWLTALDRRTGKPAWRYHSGTYMDSGAPAAADGRLYVPSMGPAFFCLEAATGRELWRYEPEPCWTTNASPSLADGRVVMTVFEEGAPFPYKPYRISTRCLDAATGAEIWRYPCGSLSGSVIAGGKVYAASTVRGDNRLVCLDLAGNGDGTTTEIWRLELGYNVLESTPAIAGNHLYVYSEDGILTCIE